MDKLAKVTSQLGLGAGIILMWKQRKNSRLIEEFFKVLSLHNFYLLVSNVEDFKKKVRR